MAPIDPISNAIAKAKGSTVEAVESTAAKYAAKVPPKPPLRELPPDDDPALLKRKAKAVPLMIQARLTEELALERERRLAGIRDTISRISTRVSIPIPDPKILQTVGLVREMKQLAKDRAKQSKEKLLKGKELYSYPLTEVDQITIENPFPTNERPTSPPIPKPSIPLKNR